MAAGYCRVRSCYRFVTLMYFGSDIKIMTDLPAFIKSIFTTRQLYAIIFKSALFQRSIIENASNYSPDKNTSLLEKKCFLKPSRLANV